MYLNALKKNTRKLLASAVQSVCSLQNTVLFSSFGGKSYSDNPRAVSEKLHALYPEIKISWCIQRSKSQVLPMYVTPIYVEDKGAIIKAYATSKVIVTNYAFPDLKKNPEQFFIQTWHGDRAFKKIQYDNPFISDDYFRPESQPGFCDLCVAGSDYGERKFRSAFRYVGEILKVGTPRDDRLVNPNPQEMGALREKLGVASNTRILLYAPTVRMSKINGLEVKDLDVEKALAALEKRYECPWVCFMRGHPGTKGLVGVQYNEKVIDVSDYEDMADLLLISDMLITDYSSCAGDFALLHRPLVLFQADKEEYMSEERNFYFDIADSPYWVVESQEQLEKIIAACSDEAAKENCDAILKFYGSCETGNSAEAVAGIIAQKLGRE